MLTIEQALQRFADQIDHRMQMSILKMEDAFRAEGVTEEQLDTWRAAYVADMAQEKLRVLIEAEACLRKEFRLTN